MGLIIERMDGKTFHLNDLGIFEEKRLEISSPNIKTETTEIQGMHGIHSGETFLRERALKASLVLLADELGDMPEKKSEIFDLFDARQFFYLTEERDIGKRWLVKSTSPFSIAEVATIGRFDISFTSFSAFSETAALIQRHFDQPTFAFINEGTEKLNMRSQAVTEIEFRGVSTGLVIRNHTTGDEWKYNGSTTADDVIVLKGIGSKKNGVSIFGDTNYQLLTFAPGQNNMEVIGAEAGFILTIRTRFYFL